MAIGEIVFGSVLTSFFQVLFDKLASLGVNYAQRDRAPPFSGINTDRLNEWKKMLDTIDAVLDDAEDRQLSGNRLVKLWLDDVRDLAYDMEDLLDEFAIRAAQAKLKAEFSTSREVQKIDDRLEDIVARKAYLSLTSNPMGRTDYNNKRLNSTCLPETQFFGREKEEAEILKLLMGEAENSDATLSIVPIVGMGGVGKTALAQRIYNDANVSNCFESRAWICVSDVFDVLDITKTVLQSITELSCEEKDLNWLQVKLKYYLSGKKFLVVLDDVWNEKYGEWITLLKPFEAGARGSKLIVTTRNHLVVSIIGASPYPLKELSVDNCLSLLAFHALGAKNFDRHPDLEKIGKKISEKCKGSPLAVKALGGLLRNKKNPNEWEDILHNGMWDLLTRQNDEVFPALKLSYIHLPSYLKRCFVYCAVFPKDYEIERDELVLLWIAEGFLDGQKAKKNNLRLGRNYFDELVSRSFLQQSSVNASKFFMHDLLNDLAKSIAGGTCFSSGESRLANNEDDASLKKARYASFISQQFATSKSLKAYEGMKVLRNFMLLHDRFSWDDKFHISNKVLHDLLTKLKYLRVFSLCHCSMTEVPNCVGDLKHLRYLNFSYTNIKQLPKSIVALHKLQALILRGCQKLSMLPQEITEMVSLEFLDIRDTWSLKDMPLSIGKLKNLMILSKFVVGLEKRSRLKELKNLPHLQGELFISELQKVEEVRDAVDANLFGKQGLSNLFLHWSEDFGNLRNDKHEAQVLHSLQPHTNLENLTISCYGGAIFPSWFDGPSYSKIVSLSLWGCPNVILLPPLGQLPSLKELSLKGLHAVRTIGSEFYGGKRPFSSLTTLKFEEMLAWKDWSRCVGGPEEDFPFSCLLHLIVRSCPSLVKTLPCQLDRLIKLEIHSCPRLNNSTSVVCLPSLRELYLEDCHEEILKFLVNLTSLIILRVQNLAELVCFNHEFMSCLVNLNELHIGRCDKLTYLWRDGNETRNLTCLRELAIQSCPQFTSFVAEEGEIELPSNLETMELRECTSLEKLPSKMHILKDLLIEKCPKLMGLTIASHDSTGNNLMHQLAALRTLIIRKCEGVKSLEEITVESLTFLTIDNCTNLESLPRYLHTLSHLTRLNISCCPALEIDDFPPLPITLSWLMIDNCPNIKSLPNQWLHLTSLEEVHIENCQNIKCFPTGGLPPNLKQLKISRCVNLKQPIREWGLHLLTTLQFLLIDFCMGGEGEKAWFPSEEDEDAWSLLFPSSLITLAVKNMRNVERLASGLHNHLSSLRMLSIEDCPKLRYLPEDGLPPSLQQLYIYGCEILEDRCSEITGDYWPLIQEIPLIRLAWVRIPL
ncbi:putative disease resistance protein At3g14460 [Syzygium oleosum]|uniref:putative disease resistance protein At3g14460 n=1 Tax=Syzygium oleosum TaxID=219896 RepID=UPI0024BB23B7|nr:putative disease resistance protein At3g14460 [Syzygium oleosum]